MLRVSAVLVISLFYLTACMPITVQPENIPISQNKLSPCPPLAPLASGSHNDLERWAVDTAFKYRKCSDKYSELAETIKSDQKLTGAIHE